MNTINNQPISMAQSGLINEMQKIAASSSASIQAPSVAPVMTINEQNAISFSKLFEQEIRTVDSLQHQASKMQQAVDMGLSDDLMGTMLESQKASVAFNAMVEVRNKLVSALEQLVNTPL